MHQIFVKDVNKNFKHKHLLIKFTFTQSNFSCPKFRFRMKVSGRERKQRFPLNNEMDVLF